MEELHAAIAAFLRAQRPPRPRPPDAALAAPGPQQTPAASFQCRFCARRVGLGDEDGGGFHFNELWEAVSCATCHRVRLNQEAALGSTGTHRQDWYKASEINPRCQFCGQRIGSTCGSPEELRPRQVRVCAACRARRDPEGT